MKERVIRRTGCQGSSPGGISGFVVLALLCLPISGWGQVDPQWLKSWNEAQLSRPKTLSSVSTIAKDSEAGTPIVIRGQIVEPDGDAAGSVVVHAYHRDHHGFDFGQGDRALTTWRLQGWAKTDAEGRFTFHTIRPAPDHLGREGAHVHFTTLSESFGRQWAPKVFFSDDPLVSEDQRQRSQQEGQRGWEQDIRTTNGVQHVDVLIQLKPSGDF